MRHRDCEALIKETAIKNGNWRTAIDSKYQRLRRQRWPCGSPGKHSDFGRHGIKLHYRRGFLGNRNLIALQAVHQAGIGVGAIFFIMTMMMRHLFERGCRHCFQRVTGLSCNGVLAEYHQCQTQPHHQVQTSSNCLHCLSLFRISYLHKTIIAGSPCMHKYLAVR